MWNSPDLQVCFGKFVIIVLPCCTARRRSYFLVELYRLHNKSAPLYSEQGGEHELIFLALQRGWKGQLQGWKE